MTDKQTHALTRTNQKDEVFVGRCFKCGQEGLPMEAVSWPCDNISGLNKDEALLYAVRGDQP